MHSIVLVWTFKAVITYISFFNQQKYYSGNDKAFIFPCNFMQTQCGGDAMPSQAQTEGK